jgi:hypothetical protein
MLPAARWNRVAETAATLREESGGQKQREA